MKVFVPQLDYFVGDIDGNVKKILQAIDRARIEKADIVLFSELAISGYPPEDLLLFPHFIEKCEEQLDKIIAASQGLLVIVGCIRKNLKKQEKHLLNSAAIISDGKLLGYKDKTLLPTYDIFDERRYFEPGGEQPIFTYKGKKIGVLICEDVWQHSQAVSHTDYLRDPVLELKEHSPDLVVCMSASPYYYQKKDVRNTVYGNVAKTLKVPMIVSNQVGGNDQLVFDGYSCAFNSKGELISQAKGFVEDDFIVDFSSELFPISFSRDPDHDLYNALVLGVKDYFQKSGFQTACLGLSGGIDSALTACIAVDALGSQNVYVYNMPSRFSTISGMEDAMLLAKRLRLEMVDIPIDQIFQNYLDLFSPYFYGKAPDTTEENIQARIRGMILMGLSNKLGHVVLSTGNKSEMAMGYSTLYGDMCGGLGVLVDVPKTLVYRLSNWINRNGSVIPQSIIDKPPSAELKDDQTDQQVLPDYEIVDLFLQEYVEEHLSMEEISKKHHISRDIVRKLAERLHNAEYKRRQAPPGIRVTKKSFTKGRVFPIVQGWVCS